MERSFFEQKQWYNWPDANSDLILSTNQEVLKLDFIDLIIKEDQFEYDHQNVYFDTFFNAPNLFKPQLFKNEKKQKRLLSLSKIKNTLIVLTLSVLILLIAVVYQNHQNEADHNKLFSSTQEVLLKKDSLNLLNNKIDDYNSTYKNVAQNKSYYTLMFNELFKSFPSKSKLQSLECKEINVNSQECILEVYVTNIETLNKWIAKQKGNISINRSEYLSSQKRPAHISKSYIYKAELMLRGSYYEL